MGPFRLGREHLMVLAGGLVLILSLIVTTAATAATPTVPPKPDTQTLQDQIDAQLLLAPGGKQIGQNQIAWRDGAVIMTFSESPMTVLSPRCPDGWTCFFEHRDWGGRMLQFRDCGIWQFFSDYGFRNQTSSWHNRLNQFVYVDDDDAGVRLWTEYPQARSSWVGSAANDRADSLLITC
jgi:Peptidase inhibitor family I36